MNLNFDVVINSGVDDVDMDYALKTLTGTSGVTCLLGEAILRGRVIERRTHANDVRAKLKQSFKSSYGQKFTLEINDKKLVSRLNHIGREAFIEVMTYYIYESLYLDHQQISPGAQSVIDQLVDIEEELTKRLRSPLTDMHKITLTNNYNVELNFKPRGESKNIITLTEITASNIAAADINQNQHKIEAVITRFNSLTGNGRLILKEHETEETISFGFYDNLRFVVGAEKLKISANLHHNNALAPNDWKYIVLTVNDLCNASGKTIKYLIRNVE